MTTEAELVQPTNAVAIRPAPEHQGVLKQAQTPAEARNEAVSRLTDAAYSRASQLHLTPEETAALQANFPDEAFKPGAAGKENLIYIEHAFLRDRLCQVFGVGQWALVPRTRWAEDFLTAKGVEASRVYVEAMLLVRGCFVAEAVGDMVYYKNNDSQNYGDAVEGAKTAALRRCAKELGIGLQAWKKDWCEGWWARKRGAGRQNPPGRVAPPSAPPHTPPQPQSAAPPALQAPPSLPTEQGKAKMLAQLLAGPDGANRRIVTEYFRKLENPSPLMPNEELEDLPLEFVPATQKQFLALKEAIESFSAGNKIVQAFPPHVLPVPTRPRKPVSTGSLAGAGVLSAPPRPQSPSDPDEIDVPFDAAEAPKPAPKVPRDTETDRWFLDIIVPVPRKGQRRDDYLKNPDTIGSLYDARHGDDDEAQIARQRLFGFVEKYEAKGWVKRDGTQMPPNASDIRFREALDAFKAFFAAEHPDEKL